MPISQGRIIDSPAYFDLSVPNTHTQHQQHNITKSIDEAANKLPPDLRDGYRNLQKFQTHTTPTSTPTQHLQSLFLKSRETWNNHQQPAQLIRKA